MGKTIAVLILGFAVLMMVAAGTLQSLLILQRIAAVSDVQGEVKVQSARDGAFYPISEARYVRAGDVIRTGQGSVTLNWIDGTRVRVGAHTALKILKSQLNTATEATVSTFRLDMGEVWVRVRKLLNPRSKFEVVTPTCTAGVRGTLFAIRVQPSGETNVSVLEGKVQVSSGGRSVVIERMSHAQATLSGVQIQRLDPQRHTVLRDLNRIDVPFVLLTEPSGNTAELHEGAILVKGVAEKGATVTVNGQTVHLNPNGNFTARVQAQRNQKVTVTVVASDERGRSATISRQVLVANVVPAREPAP
ncbi:MAG: FecR family protein [Armatimonadetes bacterium]|nr:FecR family protein [Armatimonadota bacterium]